MLIVLGLLPMGEALVDVVVTVVLLVWVLILFPMKGVLAFLCKVCLLAMMVVRIVVSLVGDSMVPAAHGYDVDETWDEVQDLGVVGERQVVGEPRRAQHALVAQVELGGLGKFTLTLEPTPVHR